MICTNLWRCHSCTRSSRSKTFCSRAAKLLVDYIVLRHADAPNNSRSKGSLGFGNGLIRKESPAATGLLQLLEASKAIALSLSLGRTTKWTYDKKQRNKLKKVVAHGKQATYGKHRLKKVVAYLHCFFG